MPADQAFLDRIQRIEKGRQWQPEGVIIADRSKGKKRERSRGGVLNLVSFLMSLALLAGAAWTLAQQDPELAADIVSGEFFAAR